MTDEELRGVLEDFKAWSGGSTPSNLDEIQEYMDVSAPSGDWSVEQINDAMRFLAGHNNDPV